jgi:hypothetical protein
MMHSELHISVNCQEIVDKDSFVQNRPIPTAHFQDLTPRASFCQRRSHIWRRGGGRGSILIGQLTAVNTIPSELNQTGVEGRALTVQPRATPGIGYIMCTTKSI